MDHPLFIATVAALIGCGAYLYWLAIRYFRKRLRVITIEEQEQRRRDGLCPQCGYDVRATPGRCPECGAEAALANRADGAR